MATNEIWQDRGALGACWLEVVKHTQEALRGKWRVEDDNSSFLMKIIPDDQSSSPIICGAADGCPQRVEGATYEMRNKMLLVAEEALSSDDNQATASVVGSETFVNFYALKTEGDDYAAILVAAVSSDDSECDPPFYSALKMGLTEFAWHKYYWKEGRKNDEI